MSDYLATGISLAAGWFISAGVNYASYIFIKTNYDTEKAVYHATLIEAGSMVGGSLAAGVFNLVRAFLPNCTGAVCCTILTGFQIIPQIQSLISFSVSLIRMNRILNSDLDQLDQVWFEEGRLINGINWLLAICIPGKMVYNTLVMNLTQGLEFCPTNGLTDAILSPFALGWTVMAPLVASAGMDIYSYVISKEKEYNSEIPFRASVISSSMSIIGFAILVLFTIFISDHFLTTILGFSLLLVTMIRVPTIVYFAFPSLNQINAAQIEAEEERQRNREIEEEMALQRRAERQQAKEKRQREEEIMMKDLSDGLNKNAAEGHQDQDPDAIQVAEAADEQ